MKREPFSFRVSLENIKRFKGMSAESKLIWLNEANEFIRCALSKKKLKNWERLKHLVRTGKIDIEK